MYSEDEEKERMLQEDEMRVRDVKELEESKKRHNEEYSSIRFEYLQNYNNILNGTGARKNVTCVVPLFSFFKWLILNYR